MKATDGNIRLSASDLSNHLSCGHLTQLDLAVAQKRILAPEWRDPSLAVLQMRGLEHERAYVEFLKSQNSVVVDLSDETDWAVTAEKTNGAMASGAEVIIQAVLLDRNWFGKADILQRVAKPSKLGAWSYEVTDTKLAKETRAGTILQLSLYSELVGKIQGELPEFLHVVSPGNEHKKESFRVSEYVAYYRYVKKRLEAAVDTAKDQKVISSYPEPRDFCGTCRWWQECDKRRRADDHLALVAGISRLQTRELQNHSIATLTALGEHPLPFKEAFDRGSKESFERAGNQARVQLQGRREDRPVHELLPIEPLRGFALLPEPSPGDLFFDIEGDPFAGSSGLEYLFGFSERAADGSVQYGCRWAFNAQEEKALFEWFIDSLMERWKKHPGFHVYHYAPYEPSAMKRLMGRYGTREEEVDMMLRSGLFVDLYAIVKQGLRASVERYSIKDLEKFFGFKRAMNLADSGQARRVLEHSIELDRVDEVSADIKETVRLYNKDDCDAALALRDWLESLRSEVLAKGHSVARPLSRDGEASKELKEAERAAEELKNRLLADVPLERGLRTKEQQAVWLAAHLLGWHRRELKVPFWDFYRLRELSDDELFDERHGLAGLEFKMRIGGTKKCPIDRYAFPPQEFDVRSGDTLHTRDGAIGKVEDIDTKFRLIDIKKQAKAAESHPSAVFAHDVVNSDAMRESVLRIAEWIAENGVDAPGPYRASRDLLLALPPRGITLPISGGESILEQAKTVALTMDRCVLPIQGPPGAGKTHTAAHMICHLVRHGRKVGITATSHAVIRNLLDKVVEVGEAEGVPVRCVQKVATESEGSGVVEIKTNEALLQALASKESNVAGATSWLWSREDAHESVDVLFIDEAGQLSLANAVAVAQAGKSVVLLGDPQQLEQPLQGSHPEGTEVSALAHLLGGHQTLAADRGLFLAETYRLHPNICKFISEQFYEGRLQPRPGLEKQSLGGDTPYAGAGLWYLPVSHDGNQNSSPEEADMIAALVEDLASGRLTWMDQRGKSRKLLISDLLIVAPYNAQVSLISDRIPDARVGTVDKFQGQEEAVVIFSLTSSSPEDAPRGMEFLYSLNRLNVAVSRARGCCIVVGNPRLFEPECRSPRQMKLANSFCRYLELARSATAD